MSVCLTDIERNGANNACLWWLCSLMNPVDFSELCVVFWFDENMLKNNVFLFSVDNVNEYVMRICYDAEKFDIALWGNKHIYDTEVCLKLIGQFPPKFKTTNDSAWCIKAIFYVIYMYFL